MNIQMRKIGAVLVLAALTAAGCGGGGGGTSVSPPPPPPPTGGIVRTGVAVGAMVHAALAPFSSATQVPP